MPYILVKNHEIRTKNKEVREHEVAKIRVPQKDSNILIFKKSRVTQPTNIIFRLSISSKHSETFIGDLLKRHLIKFNF